MKRRILAFLTIVLAFAASSSFALPARVVHGDVLQILNDLPAGGRAILRNVELGRESLDNLELEPMEVWAKDARITVYGPAGQETIIPPPAIRYFKGRVAGEEESVVFLSMAEDGTIGGMVMIGERRWTVGTGVRKGAPLKGAKKIERSPILISEIDDIADIGNPAAQWSCEVEKFHPNLFPSALAAGTGLKPIVKSGSVAGATYQLRVAVETDGELCTAFSDNTTNINAYIADIVGKASTVYTRDLKTTLVLGDVHLRLGGGGADPWTVLAGSGTGPALAEFGTYWHNNYPMATVPRSTAIFLSGKIFNGGRGWINVLCTDDFFCGVDGSGCGSATYANAYGGAYAFNGSAFQITTIVPNPDATVNGVQYGLPTEDSNNRFWMLLEVLHEVGHNANGDHTHCVALSPAEQVLYGTTRTFVDECYNLDGFGCYGPGAQTAPPEKGTIMSYCHNIFQSGFRASRYLFGKAGEPSEKMLPVFNAALEAATPNPTITTETQPVACSAGRTASVSTVGCSGCTYAWQITGGTITSSTTIASITYTPTQPSVTLTVTVITARGCGITASKTITTQCVAVSPPTGVTATATNATTVQIVWNTSVGAASYNVYRSTDGTNYPLANNVLAPTTNYNDTGRTPNTAYLYKVRAVSSGESTDSNRDLATTVIFNDDPLVLQTTVVQAVHINQLRTAVDAVRTLAVLGAGSYTDPTLIAGTTTIKALHITDLRSALDLARSTLTLSALSYGESISAQVTTIKASHFNELRNGVK